MSNVHAVVRSCAALLALSLQLVCLAPAGAQALSSEPVGCTNATAPIAEQGFVTIGGVEQWITINGDDCRHPVVLMLHGGPGSPLTPFADAIYGDWTHEFTVVQWDQRGSGRTYGRDPGAEDASLTIERMTQDGLEVATWLIGRLGTERIIVVGGSWGSALGVHMVSARPDLFHAYVGTSQLVAQRENQEASYRAVMARATAAGDTATLATLRTMGPPPWTNPRNSGMLRRATRAYEASATQPPPPQWWVPAAEYATAERQAERERGDDYSYIQFVGLEGNGMFARIDLHGLGSDFEIPMYAVHGEEDLVTTPDVARRWFDGIRAPAKRFVLLPRTGHDPNQAMIDAVHTILRLDVAPSIVQPVNR